MKIIFYRLSSCRGNNGGQEHTVYVTDSCWSTTATAPAADGNDVRGDVGNHATTPHAARRAHHVSVDGRMQRAAPQRSGLLRSHVLSGGGCIAINTEKETFGAQWVCVYIIYYHWFYIIKSMTLRILWFLSQLIHFSGNINNICEIFLIYTNSPIWPIPNYLERRWSRRRFFCIQNFLFFHNLKYLA